MSADTEANQEPPPVVKDSLTPALPMDDDLDEPLGPACNRDNPECESCQ